MWREPLRPAAVRAPALVLLALTAASCSPLDDVMAAVFGRSMRDQPVYQPYDAPLPPAEGAVPFASGNYQPGPYGVSQGQALAPDYGLPHFTQADMLQGLQSPAAALQNPVPATPESLARGEEMYQRFCAVCHGPQGLSAEAPMMPQLPMMAAWNLAGPVVSAATAQSDGFIYGMIRVGRGFMPPYGHQIPHYDRWHIVNYIRQLQGQPGGGPTPPAPDTVPGTPPPPPGGN